MKKTILPVLVLLAPAAFAASPSFWDKDIWTTWHLKPTVIQGILGLMKIRTALNEGNLKDTYVHPREAIDCGGKEQSVWRRNDGTCNDLDSGRMGSAGSRFGRNLSELGGIPKAVDESALSNPNPLEISRVLLARPKKDEGDISYIPNKGVNFLAAAWIQFQNHDWFSHGDNINDYAIAKPWSFFDPGAGPSDLRELIVPRTLIDSTRAGDDPGFPTFQNEVTHWWDGSQVYGSDPALIDCSKPSETRLRECVGGRLTLIDGRLPIDSATGKERTGFNKNWWVGLTIFHTLFARNHNQIAARLARIYPDWDDHRLFHTSRLINSAVMAKIHTIEWTPGILANRTLQVAMKANWYGVEGLLPSLKPGKETVGFLQKFLDRVSVLPEREKAVISGLMGGKKELHGTPFSLTEEFASVYRLHSLLPEKIEIRSGSKVTDWVGMGESREKKAPLMADRFGLPKLLRSFGAQNPGALVIGNYPNFLRNVSIEVPVVGTNLQFDMAAIDIIRDRERGVPRYNEFRRKLALKPISKFEDLMPQAAHFGKKHGWIVSEADAERNRLYTAKMKEIYQGDVEKIDLLVGTLAESYRPEGYGFGETMFQVFVLMASRRLQADRFYTTDYTPAIYSDEGMRIIDGATFKSLILENFPEIDPREVPENAFAPWGA